MDQMTEAHLCPPDKTPLTERFPDLESRLNAEEHLLAILDRLIMETYNLRLYEGATPREIPQSHLAKMEEMSKFRELSVANMLMVVICTQDLPWEFFVTVHQTFLNLFKQYFPRTYEEFIRPEVPDDPIEFLDQILRNTPKRQSLKSSSQTPDGPSRALPSCRVPMEQVRGQLTETLRAKRRRPETRYYLRVPKRSV